MECGSKTSLRRACGPPQEWLELRIAEVRNPLIGTTRDQRESTLRAPSFFCYRLVFVLLLEDNIISTVSRQLECRPSQVRFRVERPCTRCTTILVDQDTGEVDSRNQARPARS